MIIDHIQNLNQYLPLNPNFQQVHNYIKKTNIHSLPVGQHEIEGRNIFARVIQREHLGPEKIKLESHQKYVDLHLTLQGEDLIGCKPKNQSTQEGEYREITDDFFFSDNPLITTTLPPNYFVLFFPQDAHAALAGQGWIHKIVFKIRIPEE